MAKLERFAVAVAEGTVADKKRVGDFGFRGEMVQGYEVAFDNQVEIRQGDFMCVVLEHDPFAGSKLLPSDDGNEQDPVRVRPGMMLEDVLCNCGCERRQWRFLHKQDHGMPSCMLRSEKTVSILIYKDDIVKYDEVC